MSYTVIIKMNHRKALYLEKGYFNVNRFSRKKNINKMPQHHRKSHTYSLTHLQKQNLYPACLTLPLWTQYIKLESNYAKNRTTKRRNVTNSPVQHKDPEQNSCVLNGLLLTLLSNQRLVDVWNHTCNKEKNEKANFNIESSVTYYIHINILPQQYMI